MNPKPQIRCKNYNYNDQKWGEMEIDIDMKVYPCCMFYASCKFKLSLDPDISQSLKEKNMDQILNYFETSLLDKIKNNPYETCKKYCDINNEKPITKYDPKKYE